MSDLKLRITENEARAMTQRDVLEIIVEDLRRWNPNHEIDQDILQTTVATVTEEIVIIVAKHRSAYAQKVKPALDSQLVTLQDFEQKANAVMKLSEGSMFGGETALKAIASNISQKRNMVEEMRKPDIAALAFAAYERARSPARQNFLQVNNGHQPARGSHQ